MILCFLFSALIVALDQFFKQWVVRTIAIGAVGPEIIPGVLGLTHWENDGAMLNILSGQQWLLAAIAFIASIALILILLRYNEGFWGTLGLAAVLGGTVGNLFDRVFNQGKVIDMFRTLFINFPIFNIADIFITLGFITFLVHFIALTVKLGKEEAPLAAGDNGYSDDFDEDDDSDIESLSYVAPIAPEPAEPEYASAAGAPETEYAPEPAAEYAPVAPAAPEHATPAAPEYAAPEYAAPEYVAPVAPVAAAPAAPATPVAPVATPPSDYSSITDTTPDIAYPATAFESGIDSLETEYDLEDILREYGIENNDSNV